MRRKEKRVDLEFDRLLEMDKTHRARIRDLEDQADEEQTLNLHHFRGGEMLRC